MLILQTRYLHTDITKMSTGRWTAFGTDNMEQPRFTASSPNAMEAIQRAVRFSVMDMMETLIAAGELSMDDATLMAIDYGIDQLTLRKMFANQGVLEVTAS